MGYFNVTRDAGCHLFSWNLNRFVMEMEYHLKSDYKCHFQWMQGWSDLIGVEDVDAYTLQNYCHVLMEKWRRQIESEWIDKSLKW